MFKNKKIKKIFFPTVIVAIFVIVYRIWIFSGGYLTAGDWPFYFQNFLREFWGMPQLWEPFVNLGRVDIIPAFDLFKFLYSVLSVAGVDYDISSKILYLWPSIVFAPLFSYILLSNLLKNKIAIGIGILVFSFNTNYILFGVGNLPLMASFAFLPLIFYFFKKTIESGKLKWSLAASLALSISATYEPRAAYVIVWVLIFYFFYVLFISSKVRHIKALIKIIFLASLPMILTVLVNFYWILSSARVGALTNNELFSRNLFGNQFMNINQSFALFHPFWTGYKPTVFLVQLIPIYFWLIPVFSFLGLFLNRKNKYIPFFGFISLLGILLTKQAGIPFPDLYLWLYQHFPGFNVFREAGKFYPLIAFGYSVLIAFFIQWLWENWLNKAWGRYGVYILTIITAALFLWNTKPFITGEVGYLFIPREVPKDYLIIEKFLLGQSEYFRTLWIPISSRWSFFQNNHPKISTVDQINSDWNIFVKNKRKSLVTEAELSIGVLNFSFSQNLLNLSSIKYVFIPLQDKANDDDFFINYGKSRQYYINEMDKINWLHRINIGTKEIVVYESDNYRPHIYITNNLESISKNRDFKKIDYKFVSPTKYQINLRNINNPIFLNFSESYHPQWGIRAGDFNWWDALTKKNYFLSGNNHFKNDATLNSYLLDPKSICVQFACKQNEDRSYNIDLTLYFTPQSYMYLGLIISGATLALIVGYLIVVFGRNIYEKHS